MNHFLGAIRRSPTDYSWREDQRRCAGDKPQRYISHDRQSYR